MSEEPTNTPPPKKPRLSAGLTSLRGDREFRQVRAKGKLVRSPLFTLRAAPYRPRFGEVWRPVTVVGIVVSKKTLRRAVDRNRVRRRVREALRVLMREERRVPPCRAIVLPTPEVLRCDFDALLRELRRAFDKAAS